MLVHGDRERLVDAGETARALATAIDEGSRMQPGIDRHSVLVKAFIQASGLVQGIADAEFEANGRDAPSPLQSAGARLLLSLANAVGLSWRTGFAVAEIRLDPGALAALAGAGAIKVRLAEGYAFYALYPEAYLAAATCSGLGPRTAVIGIRSIGTGLAAMVASALGAGAPVTVRPVGHPFARRIEATPEFTRLVLAGEPEAFAIVDEGPGLSGSSFVAVADWLERSGVAPEKVHFFPGHDGMPGPQASPEVRERWRTAHRHNASFEQTVIANPEPALRLGSLVARLTGPLVSPLEDISGGGWRRLRNLHAPADPRMERRKFLARTRSRTYLVKFAGLGLEGERKLSTARTLSEAGFMPEPAGLVHGFLVERWMDFPSLAEKPLPRSRLVEHLGNYVGFRRRSLPASGDGASLESLAEMARHNVREALGEETAGLLEQLLARAGELQPRVIPVDTDNRMHAWEWLAAADGRLVKTDALDHSGGHDLIGCQDISWDVAGAIVEHALSKTETGLLFAAAGEARRRQIDPQLVDFLLPCYAAFQLGLWTLASSANATEEANLCAKTAARYSAYLKAMLRQP